VDATLNRLRDLIQQDPGGRGLRTREKGNLIDACPDDFAGACRSLAETPNAALGVVTGFFIPKATPPAGETDGPPGALYLARVLTALGVRVCILTDPFCHDAFHAVLEATGDAEKIKLIILPEPEQAGTMTAPRYCEAVFERTGPLTHLLAIERVGPTYTPETFVARGDTTDLHEFRRLVPIQDYGRCHSMRGYDNTALHSPAHLLFAKQDLWYPQNLVTLGIGDGGNEIGMGKIPWEVIKSNINMGSSIACCTPVDHLIVCGISNWGGYALSAGVCHLQGQEMPESLRDLERERELLGIMVEKGPLVDGVYGQPLLGVDGLTFDDYSRVIRDCLACLR
jgi:hypothetical protein